MHQYDLDFTRTVTLKQPLPSTPVDSPWNAVTDLYPEPKQLEFEFSYRVVTEKSQR